MGSVHTVNDPQFRHADGNSVNRPLRARAVGEERFRFAGLQVDERTRELLTESGPVAIQPKVFDLLCYLLHKRGEVVGKEELFDALWPDEVVSEGSLTSCVRRLRRALGPSGASCIRTLRGRGVAFVGDCEVVADPAQKGRAELAEADREPRLSLVGREAQLRVLQQALTETSAGTGRTILLRGAAGVGKSALVEVLLDEARAAAVECLAGVCPEGEGAPSAWVWMQIMRLVPPPVDGILPDRPPGLDRGGSVGLDRATPGPGSEGALPSPAERFRAYDAVCQTLRSVAQRTPILVVLEDLHWSDEVSISLLRYAARELRRDPVLLVATMRDDEPTSDESVGVELGRLRSDPAVQDLAVSPLEADATETLLARCLAVPCDAAVNAKVLEATGGIPLLVEQMAEVLSSTLASAENPSFDLDRLVDEVPQKTRAILERNLGRLGSESRAVLRVASILGLAFDPEDVAALLASSSAFDVGDARRLVGEALLEGERVKVVGRVGSGRRGGAFAHGLIRECLYGELGSEERARLHRFAGGLLERHWRVGLASVSEVAEHYVLGGDGAPVRKTIGLCLAAAEQAGRVADRQRRIVFLEHAERLAANPQIARTRHVEIMVALAQALHGAGRVEEAAQTRERAVAAARRTRRRVLLARAIASSGIRIPADAVLDAQRVAELEEALERTPEAEVSLRIELLRQLAWENFYHPDGREKRLEISRRVVALARDSGSRAELISALEIYFYALQGPDLVEDQLATADECVRLAESTGPGGGYGRVLSYKAQALLGVGNLAHAESAVDELRRVAGARKDPDDLLRLELWRAMKASLRGDWPQFAAAGVEAERLAQFVDQGMAVIIRMANTFGEVMVRGRVSVAEAEAGLAMLPRRLELALILVEALLAAGDRERAQSVLSERLPGGVGELPMDQRYLVCACMLASVQAKLGDRNGCGETYRTLLPHAGLHGVFGTRGGAVYYGQVATALGELALAMGKPRAAEAHVEAAIADAERLGARPALAVALASYARVQHVRGRQKAFTQATERANRVATEAGMDGVRRDLAELSSLA